MYGATALVLPLRRGQSLSVTPSLEPGITWKAYENDELWFMADFQWPPLKLVSTSDEEIAVKLYSFLKAALELNANGMAEDYSYQVITEMNFHRGWGFGSSAAVISNIAWWFDIDPFELYFKLFRGSGFDIAGARAKGPILYQLQDQQPVITEVDFNPLFRDHLYFVYLGKKQDSQVSVDRFRMDFVPDQHIIEQVDDLTDKVLKATSLEEFGKYIGEHEELIAQILRTEPVKRLYFNDFDGHLKSLGAWGGDFIMAVFPGDRESLERYFLRKGLDTIFSFDELVL